MDGGVHSYLGEHSLFGNGFVQGLLGPWLQGQCQAIIDWSSLDCHCSMQLACVLLKDMQP